MRDLRSAFCRSSRAALCTALAMATGAAVVGCSSVDSEGRLRHEAMIVEESGLNNVSFLYDPDPSNPSFRFPVRVELIGSGLVSFVSGPSPQVRDSFSGDSANPDWNKLLRQNKTWPGSKITEMLQIFVDEGLVPSRPVRMKGLGAPVLQYAGTINNGKFAVVTDNAVLIAAFEDFVREFFPRELDMVSKFQRTVKGTTEK